MLRLIVLVAAALILTAVVTLTSSKEQTQEFALVRELPLTDIPGSFSLPQEENVALTVMGKPCEPLPGTDRQSYIAD